VLNPQQIELKFALVKYQLALSTEQHNKHLRNREHANSSRAYNQKINTQNKQLIFNEIRKTQKIKHHLEAYLLKGPWLRRQRARLLVRQKTTTFKIYLNMSSKIKVAQFGLGPIGIASLNLLAKKPWVEIVGGIDINPDIIGKSLDEVCSNPSVGTAKVYDSFESLAANTEVDAILHTAGSRATVSFEQCRPMLEKGLVVVSSCEELLYPRLKAPTESEEIEALCQQSGGRILGTGVNPGFVLDVLPVCLSGMCAEVDGVYGERVVDASTRRYPLQKKVGSGMTPETFEQLGQEGKAGHAGFSESLMLIADALGWKMGPITSKLKAVVADHDITTEYFKVQKGLTAGLHQTVAAESEDGKLIHLDLKMYLDAKDPHDTIRLKSNPPIDLTIQGGVAGDTATVAALVNALPRMMNATPGIKLMTELSVPAATTRLKGEVNAMSMA
jgi:4-hydroxy-tetrahydrodipicolinate reductase